MQVLLPTQFFVTNSYTTIFIQPCKTPSRPTLKKIMFMLEISVLLNENTFCLSLEFDEVCTTIFARLGAFHCSRKTEKLSFKKT